MSYYRDKILSYLKDW